MAVGIFGLKADYHVNRHKQKMSACPFDAGFDLYVTRVEPKIEYLGKIVVISVSTAMHLVFGVNTFGLLLERSSTMTKLMGARVKTGVIDAGYTGEIIIQVVCHEDQEFVTLESIKVCANSETSFAQILPQQAFVPVFQPVDPTKLPIKGRGSNGFGSTDGLNG